MEGFFSKFNIDLDLDELTNTYLNINEDIRALAQQNEAKFCEICIDDDAGENGAKLSEFLGLEETLALGWENRTEAYDNSLWSTRVSLFNTTSMDFLTYVKRITNPSKAMLSEYGWVYLINDSSDFLDYCYGKMEWGRKRRAKAVDTLSQRRQLLADKGVEYLKFIVPEKSIVYPQYLPRIFEGHEVTEDRPAVNLAQDCSGFVSYPVSQLIDARSYGHVYFRGDSHMNWHGAFFYYQHIIEKLNQKLEVSGLKLRAAHSLDHFEPSLVAYAGDLYAQLDKEMKDTFKGAWRPLRIGDGTSEKIEYLVRYVLSETHREAVRRPVEDELLERLGERETFRFSHPQKNLPRAVIFRDSTSDYLLEPLAEHFSESLFIWHRGLVYDDVIAREKPDVVLHIMAERFVVQYSDFPVTSNLGL